MDRVNSSEKATVILVEDVAIIRQQLLRSINNHPLLTVIKACENLKQGLSALSEYHPDVLLVDLGLPDGSGIDLIRAARQQSNPIEVMVITVFGDERNVLNAIEAGASSYLLKDGDMAYIADAVIKLLAGESPISAAIARQLLNGYNHDKDISSDAELQNQIKLPLTNREIEVLRCMAKGYSYNETANMLEISGHTVASHIKKIYRKLEVNSRSEAVYEAIQGGLLDIGSGDQE